MNRDKLIRTFIISVFVLLYLMVSGISMVNSFDFFHLSQGTTMSWILAISFEVGAACSLASLIILDRVNKNIVWILFILLTFFQIMNNVYHTFIHLNDYQGWIELFGLNEEDQIFQKRILSIISGAILPLVALGFIKSLVDYIKPSDIEPISSDIKSPNDIPKDIDNNTKDNVLEDLIEGKKEIDHTNDSKETSETENISNMETNNILANDSSIEESNSLQNPLEDTYNRYLESLDEKENMKHKLQMDYSHPGIDSNSNTSKTYDSKNNPN